MVWIAPGPVPGHRGGKCEGNWIWGVCVHLHRALLVCAYGDAADSNTALSTAPLLCLTLKELQLGV